MRKLIVHTDVLLDYVIHSGRRMPVLRRAMQEYFCYTTVFTAIELFALARTERQRSIVTRAMSALKILGLNARSAPRFGKLFASNSRCSVIDVLIAGVCLEAKLPLLVLRKNGFPSIKGLHLLTASAITGNKNSTDS